MICLSSAEFIKPFGFELGGYAAESEHACFTSPDLALARTQLLDYFYQQKDFLQEDHVRPHAILTTTTRNPHHTQSSPHLDFPGSFCQDFPGNACVIA